MKKAILMMITAAMLCGTMTACVSTKVEDSVPDKPEATTQATEEETETEAETEEETTTEAETEADTTEEEPAASEDEPAASEDEPAAPGEESGADSSAEGNDTPAVSGDTLGETLRADFEERAADGMLSCQILADELIKNPAIQFGPATMPVQPGLLTGFGNAEITGFRDGIMFAPMIGSIAFVGYVFELEEGTDGEAFMQTLKDNADPRWNICVEAEEMVVSQTGNKVFFVMCPTSLEN